MRRERLPRWLHDRLRRLRYAAVRVTPGHRATLRALVDSDWYSEHYGDVGRRNPVRHFLRKGLREERAPNALFDPDWYLEHYPQIAGVNSIAHYVRSGAGWGLSPHPLFNSNWYSVHNPDVQASGANPLAHYLRHGGAEGRSPHPLFDGAYYLEHNPEVRRSGANPLVHYLTRGEREGAQPNPWFDPSWYREHYQDVDGSALVDYVQHGAGEARAPHPRFDVDFYLREYPDVAQEGGEPLTHFLHYGWALGFAPNRDAQNQNTGTYRLAAAASARRGLGALLDEPYEEFRRQRLDERRVEYPGPGEPGLLSFLSPVYDTPAPFLEALARDLFQQDADVEFEWVILDNGSTNLETRRVLQWLGEQPSVHLARVDDNIGIIRAMRSLLERARGRYVLPLDSDDRLTIDCVRVVTWALRHHGYPPVLYTDEDKTDGTHHTGYELKADWDPALFFNACYVAHLTAFDRERALSLGVYDDPGVEGCHDWDTFTRFALAEETPTHVPEVVYSWRTHHDSTAARPLDAKPFVRDSHEHLLRKIVAAQPHPDHFHIESSPIVDLWLRRVRVEPRGITTISVGSGAPSLQIPVDPAVPHVVVAAPDAVVPADLRGVVADAARRGDLVHLLRPGILPDDDEWAWEAMAVTELFPDTVAVGGPLHRTGRIVDAGRYLGFGWACGSPFVGSSPVGPGYATLGRRHSVSAISGAHAVLDAPFLLATLEQLGAEPSVTLDDLGSWIGLAALRGGRRVVSSPFLGAYCLTIDANPRMQRAERRAFLTAAMDAIPDTRYFSRHLSLDADQPFRPALARDRDRHLDELRCLDGERSAHDG